MFWRSTPTTSTGSTINGGKPPPRTEVAMISRANGNNSRGHSIMTSGCRFSFGALTMRNTPAYARSKLNITLPAFSALPSTESVTSYSFSAILLALTLIWILIAGCCGCGASEPGAFGFSNDRSLVYCASTFSWGGAPASGGAPLPLVMKVSPGAFQCFSSERRPLLRPNSLVWRENAVVEASGYHSPASFHKDDERTQPAEVRPMRSGTAANTCH